MTNYPPIINNQPKSITSEEKNGYSAIQNVLHVKSICSVMEIKNEESRSKSQFGQIIYIVSIFLNNYV